MEIKFLWGDRQVVTTVVQCVKWLLDWCEIGSIKSHLFYGPLTWNIVPKIHRFQCGMAVGNSNRKSRENKVILQTFTAGSTVETRYDVHANDGITRYN